MIDAIELSRWLVTALSLALVIILAQALALYWFAQSARARDHADELAAEYAAAVLALRNDEAA
jgi:hypothetical protein